MSVTWDKLPKEILKIVFKSLKVEFDHLTDFDLRECALVCRGWVSAAQEVIFSRIYMRTEEEFEKNIYTVTLKPSLALLVKSLDYHFDDFIPTKHLAHLAIIANFFPMLEQFDTSGFINDSCYESFCNLVKIGKFPHLKVFPSSHNYFQDELRASCMILYMKNSITEVGLSRRDHFGLNDYRHLCDALPQFPGLYKVNVKIHSGVPQSTIKHVESSTRSATLREVKFNFDFPDNSTLFQLNHIQPALNIKTLIVLISRKLGVDFSNFVLYLINKFPNLESLCVLLRDQWRVDSIEDDAAERASETDFFHQFFKYLAKLLDYSIDFCYLNATNVNHLFKLYFLYIPDKEKSQVHLDVSCDSNNVTTPLIYIGLSRKRGKRHISLRLRTHDQVGLVYSLLEDFGYYFESLKLGNNKDFEHISSLNHLFRYCKNLKSLNIRGISKVDKADDSRIYYTVHNNLEKLTMREFSSGLLPLISARFPCIKTVHIQHKFRTENEEIHNIIADRDTSPTKENQSTKITHFDMQNFSLQHLIVDIGDYRGRQEAGSKNIYLKFITQNDGESRYVHLLAPPLKEDFTREPFFQLISDPTQEGYSSTIGVPNYLHYEVKCNSIEKVTIIEHTVHRFNLVIKVDVLQNLQIPVPKPSFW